MIKPSSRLAEIKLDTMIERPRSTNICHQMGMQPIEFILNDYHAISMTDDDIDFSVAALYNSKTMITGVIDSVDYDRGLIALRRGTITEESIYD